MLSAAFARGIADFRAGRAPDFDNEVDALTGGDWDYERGRQWAVVAPVTMPLKIGRRLNPDAIEMSNGSQIP
jgi:hypothetical protein